MRDSLKWGLLLATALIFGAVYRLYARAGGAGSPPRRVYVSLRGAKYHFPGCRFINRSMKLIDLSEAVKRFEPCARCS